MALAGAAAGLPLPRGRAHAAYLLAEIAGPPDHAERLAAAGLPADTAVALDGPGCAGLWAYRERHTEAIGAAGIPHKLDVTLPLARIEASHGQLGEAVAAAAGPPCQVIVFGHLGAGNLHVNVLGPDPDDEAVDDAVLRLAAAHGGSIPAEHVIGRAKARWLHLSRSPAEIAAMRAIRAAPGPSRLLNPGVLFIPVCSSRLARADPAATGVMPGSSVTVAASRRR